MEDSIVCTPVMLPTHDKRAPIFLGDVNFLRLNIGGKYQELSNPQHLYFVSDEEIKEGELCMHFGEAFNWIAFKYDDPKTKKIVASTDEMDWPDIPDFFIQKWVEKQGKIDKVKLERTEYVNIEGQQTFFGPKITGLAWPKGEVIILPIEEKLYNLEEVKTIALDIMNLGMELRQNQLSGHDQRSGNEVLDNYFKEKIK